MFLGGLLESQRQSGDNSWHNTSLVI